MAMQANNAMGFGETVCGAVQGVAQEVLVEEGTVRTGFAGDLDSTSNYESTGQARLATADPERWLTSTDPCWSDLKTLLLSVLRRRVPSFGPPRRLGADYATHQEAAQDLAVEVMAYLLEEGPGGSRLIAELAARANGSTQHLEALVRNTVENVLLHRWAAVNQEEDLIRRRIHYLFEHNPAYAFENAGRTAIVALRGMERTPVLERSEVQRRLANCTNAAMALVSRNEKGRVDRSSLEAVIGFVLDQLDGRVRVRDLFPGLFDVLLPEQAPPISLSSGRGLHGADGSEFEEQATILASIEGGVRSESAVAAVARELSAALTAPARRVLRAAVVDRADATRIRAFAKACGMTTAATKEALESLTRTCRETVPEDFTETEMRTVLAMAACPRGRSEMVA